jgi:hypothetical protein
VNVPIEWPHTKELARARFWNVGHLREDRSVEGDGEGAKEIFKTVYLLLDRNTNFYLWHTIFQCPKGSWSYAAIQVEKSWLELAHDEDLLQEIKARPDFFWQFMRLLARQPGEERHKRQQAQERLAKSEAFANDLLSRLY